MSISEILHEIEALPVEERARLLDMLSEPTEAERKQLDEKLRQRPTLGAELAERIDRMQAGDAIRLDDVRALFQQLDKLGL
jgi:hypothetical protein